MRVIIQTPHDQSDSERSREMRAAIARRFISFAAAVSIVALCAAASGAAPEAFEVQLSGAQQVPPVETAGAGTARISYDPATREVSWVIAYKGLSSAATMAHFHGPAAAGKSAGVQVWLTEKGGKVESPIKGHATLTPEQASQFLAGEWYVNVHTQTHPGGEIRGQVVPPRG
jgi:hypothetical protein